MPLAKFESFGVLGDEGLEIVVGEAEIPLEGLEPLEGEAAGLGHHEEAGEAVGGSAGAGEVDGALKGVEEEGGVGEAEAGKVRVAGVGELVEEGGVAAEEAEDGYGEAEEALLRGEDAGREVAVAAPLDGVLEQAGGLEVRLGVDDVVQTSVLHPLQPDSH